MGREDKTSWKASYFVKLVVSREISSCHCAGYLQTFFLSNFSTNILNVSLWELITSDLSSCNRFVALWEIMPLFLWERTQWSAKQSVDIWRITQHWRSEFFLFAYWNCSYEYTVWWSPFGWVWNNSDPEMEEPSEPDVKILNSIYAVWLCTNLSIWVIV